MADLILISGLPGAGKTTLAKAFCEQAAVRHFNSDAVRESLDLRGRYQPDDKARVYATLLEKTRETLLSGQNTVVDSTFYLESIRQPFRQMAADCGAALHWIEVMADEALVRERVGQARPDSEADFVVYQKIKAACEPLTDPHLIIRTDRLSLPEQVRAVARYVAREMSHVTEAQLREIVRAVRFPGHPGEASILETHISWVILARDFAFKIKKAVRLPFLDFRTPGQRLHFCREELRLNRRLAPEIYLDVLPIGTDPAGQIRIGEPVTEPIDYAVQMRRLDNRFQMDRLLAEHAVTRADMGRLGRLIARFHRENTLAPEAVNYQPGDAMRDFEALFELEPTALEMLGERAAGLFQSWRNQLKQLFERLEPLIRQRIENERWVDGHGDLHARNIFLLPEGPVVFDCIEFNPHFRTIDRFSDLAFLCMDLDANDHPELAIQLMNTYNAANNYRVGSDELLLFLFYKAYRANVRLKVALLEWQQHRKKATQATGLRYWALLEEYRTRLARRAGLH